MIEPTYTVKGFVIVRDERNNANTERKQARVNLAFQNNHVIVPRSLSELKFCLQVHKIPTYLKD